MPAVPTGHAPAAHALCRRARRVPRGSGATRPPGGLGIRRAARRALGDLPSCGLLAMACPLFGDSGVADDRKRRLDPRGAPESECSVVFGKVARGLCRDQAVRAIRRVELTLVTAGAMVLPSVLGLALQQAAPASGAGPVSPTAYVVNSGSNTVTPID